MPDIEDATKSDEMVPTASGPQPAAQLATQMIADLNAKAKKAEDRIWDWWTEWRWTSEGRKMLDMAGKIGTSVLKGPVPQRFKAKKANFGALGGASIEMIEKIRPVSKCLHPKDFFPDPGCGEDIHCGSYVWERGEITAKGLRDLLGMIGPDGRPMYLDDQIMACLAEGPQGKLEGASRVAEDKTKFEIWYFYGSADHEDMKAAGCECDEAEVYPCEVTMVNGRVIKCERSLLDSGEFPYDVVVWQQKPGTWTGIGVGHQIATPQRMLIAATRNLMDNAGLSSAPILVIDDDVIEPADGSGDVTLRPRMTYRRKVNADPKSVKDAIVSITIPSLQGELMGIINFALQMAEKVTGITVQTSGQQGENEETATGRQILQNNAGSLIRRVCKIFDDRMAPHIGKYYEWLLLFGEHPDEKGDWVIDVMGSTVLFERDAQNMLVAQMIDRAANPIYGLNPEKLAKEWLISQGVDITRVEYSEDEKKQMAEAAQQKPADPTIEAAKLRAESAEKIAATREQGQTERAKLDADRDTIYEQAAMARAEELQRYNLEKLAREKELALLKESGENARLIEKLKTEVAKLTMELNTQRELAHAARMDGKDNPGAEHPQVRTPPSEPPARAQPGQAFPQ
jgi:hypothetical protein